MMPHEHKPIAAPVSAAVPATRSGRRAPNPTRWVGARPSSVRVGEPVAANPTRPAGARPSSAPAAAGPRVAPTVDRIDVIDSPAGAVGGYGAIRSGGHLDVPGPFNDPKNGGVANFHQIHFHLDAGSPDDLVPERWVQRTMWLSQGVGANGKLVWLADSKRVTEEQGDRAVVGGDTYAPDGPGEHEIIRSPDSNLLSVADGPGVGRMDKFPFVFKASFIMTVTNRHTGTQVARVAYDVLIVKLTPTETQNKENKITVLKKTDVARGRDLP